MGGMTWPRHVCGSLLYLRQYLLCSTVHLNFIAQVSLVLNIERMTEIFKYGLLRVINVARGRLHSTVSPLAFDAAHRTFYSPYVVAIYLVPFPRHSIFWKPQIFLFHRMIQSTFIKVFGITKRTYLGYRIALVSWCFQSFWWKIGLWQNINWATACNVPA